MKALLNRTSVSIAVLIAALFCGQVPATAQTQIGGADQNTPSQRPRAEGSALGLGAFAGPFGPGAQRLMEVLTEDQRASLREAMNSQREKTRDLQQKLRDARKGMFEAGLAPNFDEDALRSKAMGAAKLEAEMTVLRAKALSQIKPHLSAEQIEKLKSSFPSGPPEAPGETRGRRSNFRRDQNDLPVPTQQATP